VPDGTHAERQPVLTRPFVLLMAAHFLQALGYASLILLPLFLDHLGASRTEVGVVMAASAVGGLLVRPLVAWSLDRVGRKPTLVVGTLVMVAGMASFGLVRSVGVAVVAIHAVIGMAEAALFSGFFTVAADLVPEQRRTEGLALFGISGLVPLVVNPIAGGLGVEGADLPIFFVVIAGLIALSLPLLWPVPEYVSRRVPDTEPPRVRTVPDTRWMQTAAVVRSLAQRSLWPVWTATMVFSGMVAIFMSFVTVAAADAGAGNAGIVWLTYAAGSVGIRLFGASIPDRIGPSRMVPPALLAYVAAFVVAAYAGSDQAFALSGLLAGFAHGMCFPVLSGQAVTRTPVGLRGSAMSLFTALWDLVKLILVPAAGWLADATSDQSMLLASAAAAVVGLVLWALLERGVPAAAPNPAEAIP
jgi:MFS family permease